MFLTNVPNWVMVMSVVLLLVDEARAIIVKKFESVNQAGDTLSDTSRLIRASPAAMWINPLSFGYTSNRGNYPIPADPLHPAHPMAVAVCVRRRRAASYQL
jgi:hypothetical protein